METKMSYSYYLSDELVLEILSKLPVKALARCTSVCKLWLSIIRSPAFIMAHLNRTKDPLLLVRVCSDRNEHYSLHFDSQDIRPYMELQFSPPQTFNMLNPFFRVVGSCNGLVCLADDMILYGDTYILWNPLINRYLVLPQPKFSYDAYGPFDLFVGFGYDIRANDFKVLRLVELRTNMDFSKPDLKVEVFSANAGSWKDITTLSPKYLHIARRDSQAFVNGIIHFIGFQFDKKQWDRNLVIGFDVGDEDFCRIMLPECLISAAGTSLSISEYKGSSIAVFHLDNLSPNPCTVWVMEEYGVVESWTKICNISVPMGQQLPMALGFRQNGDVLLEDSSGLIVSTCPKTHSWKRICEKLGYNSCVDTFVESLMLLDKANTTNHYDDIHVSAYAR